MEETANYFKKGVHSIPQSITNPIRDRQLRHLSQIITPVDAREEFIPETTVEQPKSWQEARPHQCPRLGD